MSYHEKKTIVSLVWGILIFAAYCIYAFGKYQPAVAGDLKHSAVIMLIFIGIGIVAMIIIQIVFHMVFAASIAIKEGNCDEKKINQAMETDAVEDEMVKLIELKASKAGSVLTGIGFVAGLVSLALDAEPVVMLNIIFLSCGLGTIIEGFVSLRYYRKGMVNG